MARKTYIGYDLGDGETITDLVTLESGVSTTNTKFDNMTMPDSTTPGQAMPTMFAFDENGEVIFSQTISADLESVSNIVVNFKRCPSDLLKPASGRSNTEQIAFIKKLSAWPNASVWPEGNTHEMLNFKNSVIAFTNAIFTEVNYVNRLKSAAQNSDEIVFCVGHPTNWTELDIAIYELIFKNSILGSGRYEGKKSTLIMEAESRAAFLYSKDIEAFGRLPKGSSVLLIDIGSSTIDLTAMTAASNNHQYNSGSNYLGARSIDFMIRDWYLKLLQQQPLNWAMYQSLVKNNPTFSSMVTFLCRRAKEEYFSSPQKKSAIQLFYPPIKLSEQDIDQIIGETPIAKTLRETINLNASECALMGNKSWKELFKEFLEEKKAEMTNHGVRIGYIILTGSASKMPFVPQIVLEVFNEVSADSLKYDMDPSRTISQGLALVGPSNEKSKAFRDDLNHLIDKKLDKIIANNIPALGKEMGTVISSILTPKMKAHIRNWKEGKIDTLNTMNKKINADCSEENLTKLLSENPKYKKTIENWLKDKVGKDIAIELKAICDKYGVRDISVDDLNIMAMPKISIGDIPIDPLDFMDTLGNVIALISGVVTAASITTIMAVVLAIISIISESLATSLFIVLVEMYPVGWGIIAAILGVGIGVLMRQGVQGFKDMFKNKVMGWNLPKLARKTMTDDKIDKSFTDANIPNQIETAFADAKLKDEIVKNVSANLKVQIEKRAEDIKYAIESK